MTTTSPDVRVVSWSYHAGVLAYVDGVRVRVKPRGTKPPRWLCDDHPSDGRTSCPHIEALAATPTDPTKQAKGRGRRRERLITGQPPRTPERSTDR